MTATGAGARRLLVRQQGRHHVAGRCAITCTHPAPGCRALPPTHNAPPAAGRSSSDTATSVFCGRRRAQNKGGPREQQQRRRRRRRRRRRPRNGARTVFSRQKSGDDVTQMTSHRKGTSQLERHAPQNAGQRIPSTSYSMQSLTGLQGPARRWMRSASGCAGPPPVTTTGSTLSTGFARADRAVWVARDGAHGHRHGN